MLKTAEGFCFGDFSTGFDYANELERLSFGDKARNTHIQLVYPVPNQV